MSLAQILARLALAFSATALIAGCSTTTIVADPLTLAPSSKLKPVVLSITANTSEIRGFDQIEVTRVSELQAKGEPDITANFILKQVVLGLARDTSLFIGALPAGEYYFTSFMDSKTQKILRISSKSKLLGHFVVDASRPVDLGRLVVTPMNSNAVYGRSKRVTSNLPLMQRFSPPHAALFAGEVDGGWKPGDADEISTAVEGYAMARPVGAECITGLDDGSVIAASRLGTVLKRNPEGRWGALRSEGLESLLCVIPAKLPNAELIAVGEFNTMLRKPPGVNKLLPIDTGNLPPGNIMRIYGNAENGWVIALQHQQEVTIFHSKQLEGGAWRELRKENIAPNFWSGGGAFWMWKTSTGFAYVGSAGPFRFYDEASGTWSEHSVPNNANVINVSDNPNGAIGLVTSPGGGFGGIFATVWYSTDQAKSWKIVNVPFKIKIHPVQFTTDGAMLSVGGVMSTQELQISRDNGLTWSHFAPYDVQRGFVTLKDGTMFDKDGGAFGLFSIRMSKDGGKTWVTEYSNFDRQAYDAREAAKAK